MTLGKLIIKSLPWVVTVVLVATLVGKNSPRQKDEIFSPLVKRGLDADLRIKNGHFLEIEGDKVVWQLEVASAQLFEDNNYAQLETIKAQTFTKNGHTVQIEGKTGNLHLDTKDFTINGQVKVVSDNHVQLTTDSLEWNDKEQKIFSQDWVDIKREGLHLVGKGIETNNQLDRLVIKEQVTTYLN